MLLPSIAIDYHVLPCILQGHIVSNVHNTGELWREPWIWTHVAVTHLPCRSQVSEDCRTLMYIVRSADIACRYWPLKRKLSTAIVFILSQYA